MSTISVSDGAAGLLTIAALIALLAAVYVPFGDYMARVFTSPKHWGVEKRVYRLLGVNPDAEQTARSYTYSVLGFSLVSIVALFAILIGQQALPFDRDLPGMPWDMGLNTAVSFVTNTNWQSYGGEVVVVALVRGFARHSAATIGNVWVDLTRATLWVLLPLSFLLALAFAGLGVIQTLSAYVSTTGVEGASTQLALGPVASQLAIKMLGTNGGGFFNANSAHPFENPSAITNALQMLAIFIVPAALCLVFGRMVGDRRQGFAVLAAMTVLFVVFAVTVNWAEQQGNPALTALGVDQAVSSSQPGGNMEGKEARFGINASTLFAAVTTSASCGAVNAMHDSFTPLGGAVPMVLMQLGEVVFGGVGTGLYGMLVFAMLAVFIAGLMIGRTPEYLGKKIEANEMKMVSLAILITPLLVLLGTALAVSTEAGRAGILNPGPHGFSEILYALTSAANNNGSAFAGLSANTPFYNVLLAAAMWFGRFGVIVAVLAMAGSLASKKRAAATAGTLPTHGPLFVGLLIGIVLLVGLLNYVPALALGPVVEHLTLVEPLR